MLSNDDAGLGYRGLQWSYYEVVEVRCTTMLDGTYDVTEDISDRRAKQVGGQAVLGRQNILPTPWLTERHGYDPTCGC